MAVWRSKASPTERRKEAAAVAPHLLVLMEEELVRVVWMMA
jgi:hypothetical protein